MDVIIKIIVRLEVFTTATMKNAVFWGVKPCGAYKNQRYGGTCRLQSGRQESARNDVSYN
jgi:hypothetical protein